MIVDLSFKILFTLLTFSSSITEVFLEGEVLVCEGTNFLTKQNVCFICGVLVMKASDVGLAGVGGNDGLWL